jgi:hypothetical protein
LRCWPSCASSSRSLIALIVAGVFVAYQSGAFDKWVDKGKTIIHQQG